MIYVVAWFLMSFSVTTLFAAIALAAEIDPHIAVPGIMGMAALVMLLAARLAIMRQGGFR